MLVFALSLLLCNGVSAAMGVREAAAALERQLGNGTSNSASQTFQLPLAGTPVVLSGEARIDRAATGNCRRTLELAHNQPFNRQGLRITNLSRRSVQDGPCRNFGEAMRAQAEASAKNIGEQIGLDAARPDLTPGQRMLVNQSGAGSAARLTEAVLAGAPVALVVLDKAIIRDAPNLQGEKLSRADRGTRLKAQRIPGNPEWFMLDGGLRFISAKVVDVSDAATARAPARGDTSRVRLRVMERAVLRNAPSFKGKKVAQLAAGVERLARKVPGMSGWFQLTDGDGGHPLYIHESVVSQKRF